MRICRDADPIGRASRAQAAPVRGLLVALAASTGLVACATMPTPDEIRGGRGLPEAAAPVAGGVRDGRARFRELFCGRLRAGPASAGLADCEDWLWRLRDEPPAPARLPALAGSPRDDPRPLRVLLVTGAFSDCFGDEALPFGEVIPTLRLRGYRIDTLRVSGRSSATHNARQVLAALDAMDDDAPARLVLVGYSKGTVDILEALALAPHHAVRVAALVSVAGPVGGTPLARTGRRGYDALLAGALPTRCDPGDGGVVDSLLPEARRDWLAAHPLPPTLRAYSLVAVPQRERLARLLHDSWRLLARTDRWNDGQVTVGDALLPGSTLLGLLNADHWAVALRIERSLPHLASRRDPRPFPQAALLEAVLAFVDEDSARAAAGGATVATAVRSASRPAPGLAGGRRSH